MKKSKFTEEQIAFLYANPPSVQIGRTLYVHASPRNDVDVFTERTPEERIAFLFEDIDADVIVCGHVHTQYERVVAGKRIVNSGSVGMPYEDEPGAYWRLDLEPRRTRYDGAEQTASREECDTTRTLPFAGTSICPIPGRRRSLLCDVTAPVRARCAAPDPSPGLRPCATFPGRQVW